MLLTLSCRLCPRHLLKKKIITSKKLLKVSWNLMLSIYQTTKIYLNYMTFMKFDLVFMFEI